MGIDKTIFQLHKHINTLQTVFQERTDLLLLLEEPIDELLLKLFIFVNFVNYFDISLYFSRIFFCYSRFFSAARVFIFLEPLLTQQVIFGPVHSILVISFMFSSKISSSLRKTSFILNLGFEAEAEEE